VVRFKEVRMAEERHKVLLVEDDSSLLSSLGMFLGRNGCDVDEVKSAEDAQRLFESSIYDLVVTDLKLLGKDGLWLLQHVKREQPETPVIMMSAYADVETAVTVIKEGAADFLVKPLMPPQFIKRCREVIEQGAASVSTHRPSKVDAKKLKFQGLVGKSHSIKKVKDMMRLVGKLPVTILISGESGSGKESAVRFIHSGTGEDRPFVVVNCASVIDENLEEILFQHDGLIYQASGGTLYLEEISDLPEGAQKKLLSVIDSGRLPNHSASKGELGVRFMCSTSKCLKSMMTAGEFSKDLYYRVNVVELKIDPLRERVEDIPSFMAYFLTEFNQKHEKLIRGYSREVYNLLTSYFWPGNVRELRNLVERAVIFCHEDYIQVNHIPDDVKEPGTLSFGGSGGLQTLRELEKQKILETLNAFGGNRAMTAKVLGIGRNTLWRKLKEYEIDE